MGMSRSGSSLTTSIIAAMLRNGSRSDETAWRGLGRALPSDSANPGGYYEREDVVRLNYATISSVTGAGRWLAPVSASDQARELHSFLHCGEVSGLVSPLDAPTTEQRLTPAALCLWRELESGRALKGHSQRETPLAAQLCYGSGAGRGPAASPLITTRSG
ncbi:hypothetical protein EMIHUDRAFT_241442 [Emiliania huxleyi CCMP1516]|uniref:Uncharacterized protein n=2 Tax=Emiliania huxleyi TaxID=2903 RepID=A0A0D3JCL9_EMIH1|nr:hypothetical protein EMIHUDRAFT_241442 [Emiliania huxleyi CCMP1516]EOD21254.1 hypothetical protein EMIHUDRAFT_241442 [Emiliania huxleyi CCMP1516]|eukprot:XP_005773683.1 hypothetical protein EMIHUDRAFT_241442 [Emiliania huxleyi CCMP1516]